MKYDCTTIYDGVTHFYYGLPTKSEELSLVVLYFLSCFFFSFISFPLSAFCDFSVIFHPIFLISHLAS